MSHRHARPRGGPAVLRAVRRRAWVTLAAIVGVLAFTAGYLIMASGPVTFAEAGTPPLPAARYYQWPGGEAPQGITLSALQAYVMRPQVVTTLEHQMLAAKTSWHANTIRLQVTQDRLVGADGRHFRPAYMAAVRAVTGYGLHLGLTMVLNAQTEVSTGYSLSERLPTYATTAFWQQMMRRYKNNPRVVFDLFNEPRKCGWAQWQAAMQPLVTMIRDAGARNQIWVNGLNWGSTLAGVPLLNDPLHDVVYTIHHPGSDASGTQTAPTTAQLDAAFGDLAARGVPVEDAEFANYDGSYNWYQPGPNVRRYLAYLTVHHVGMLAWSLLPGALNSTLDYRSVSHEPQGDGQQVRRWFTLNAKAATR